MSAVFNKSFWSVLVIASLAALCKQASAQTEKGMFAIGGSAGISESVQGTSQTFSFSIAPSMGFFAVRNFLVGGSYSLSVGSSRTLNATTDVHSSTTTFTTLVGPYLKYYFGKKAMKPFLMANGGYSVYTAIRTNSAPGSSASITNYDGGQYGGSAGVAYFFNPHVSFETSLYVTTTAYQTQLPTTRFGISLGLYAFLDKKKRE